MVYKPSKRVNADNLPSFPFWAASPLSEDLIAAIEGATESPYSHVGIVIPKR